MTKHFPVWTPCLIVFDNIWTSTNILIKHFARLDGDQTCLIPFSHSIQHQHVWSPNSVWSCLIAKYFPLDRAYKTRTRRFTRLRRITESACWSSSDINFVWILPRKWPVSVRIPLQDESLFSYYSFSMYKRGKKWLLIIIFYNWNSYKYHTVV